MLDTLGDVWSWNCWIIYGDRSQLLPRSINQDVHGVGVYRSRINRDFQLFVRWFCFLCTVHFAGWLSEFCQISFVVVNWWVFCMFSLKTQPISVVEFDVIQNDGCVCKNLYLILCLCFYAMWDFGCYILYGLFKKINYDVSVFHVFARLPLIFHRCEKLISKFHFLGKSKISIPENHYWTIFYDIRVYKKRSFHIINLYDPISLKYTLKGISLYSQMTISYFFHTWKYYFSTTSKRHFSANTSNASDRWFDRFSHRFHGVEHSTWIIGQWTQGGFRFCCVGRSGRFSSQSGKLLTAIFPKTERFPFPMFRICVKFYILRRTCSNLVVFNNSSSEEIACDEIFKIFIALRSRWSFAFIKMRYC